MTLPQWVGVGARVIGAGASEQWTAQELQRHVTAAALLLAQREWTRPLGLLADNSPHWIHVDLAAHLANVTLVPLPEFFSPAQLEHAARSTRMQALCCANAALAASLGFRRRVGRLSGLWLFERETDDAVAVSEPTAAESLQKITFTSGSTGTPKGVCLTAAQQLRPAQALAHLTAHLNIARHLNLLPLPVLLENVAGVYTPLLLGATCICPPLIDVGMSGASGFDPERCLNAIARHVPDSVIVLPQMLRALVTRLERQVSPDSRIGSLKFVAVGGAKTPPNLIVRARELGLPVYEGYGLSECASVIAVNVPAAHRLGSVGRALPGTMVRVADDGEIEVSGRGFAGYLGTSAIAPDAWFKTGDLGSIDRDGYIFVDGRKGNVLITGFGRNVSPEWPESLLLASPFVAQAVVFGEGRPYLVAVLAAAPQVTNAELISAVDRANCGLPDYARIGAWLRAAGPFTPANGLATANGRVRRQAVWARYADPLNRLYHSGSDH